jgi:hypothetical protein
MSSCTEPARLSPTKLAGVAGQVRRCRHDAQPLDRQLLRPRLRDGNLQPHPIADDRSKVARQQPRRRLDGTIEGETQAVGERDPDGGIRVREPLGIDLEIALPTIQRPLAGQRQRERAGGRVAGEGGEEPAGLLRLHRQIESRRRQLQGGIDAGAGGRLIDALQRQLRIRRATVLGGVEMAAEREAGGLPEDLLAKIECGDGQLLHGCRRQPVRQLRKAEGLGRLGLGLGRRQPVQADPGGADLIDPDTAAQQRARRPGESRIIDLEPDAVRIGGRDAAKAHVDRHRPLQPGDLDRHLGRAQEGAEPVRDHALAEAGLRSNDHAGDQQQDQGERHQERKADAPNHGSAHKKTGEGPVVRSDIHLVDIASPARRARGGLARCRRAASLRSPAGRRGR